MVRFIALFITIICSALFTLPALPTLAQEPPAVTNALPTSSGLPIPRFVSLRTKEINLRTGPGVRYPVEWVYRKEGLPVEVTAEYDTWRRIRDIDGSEGWVHQSMLSGKRMMLATGTTVQSVYKNADGQADVVAKVEPQALGEILKCEQAWCEVRFDSIKGYMPKTGFFGAYANEVIK